MSDESHLPPPIDTPPEPPPVADTGHEHRDHLAAELKRVLAAQNLPFALFGGLVAAGLGAIAWAAITVATKHQIGFMAIGVGFLVGWAVARLGNGVTPLYGVVGALCALLGCVAGNVLSACYFLGQRSGEDMLKVLESVIANGQLVTLITSTFSGMDLLFYGLAIIQAYRGSFTPLRTD